MHTVELIEHALRVAQALGMRVRQEWLDGREGGLCEFKNQKWLFVDLALPPNERLDQVLSALRHQPGLDRQEMPRELSMLLDVRKSA